MDQILKPSFELLSVDQAREQHARWRKDMFIDFRLIFTKQEMKEYGMSWEDTIRNKMADLNLIASWAAITNLGRVRDYCRSASYELRLELERCAKMDAIDAVNLTTPMPQSHCASDTPAPPPASPPDGLPLSP